MRLLNLLRWILVFAVFLVVVPAASAEPLDFDMPMGHFFKQGNGKGGAGDTGFSVVDDDAPFWTAFQRLGGVEALGYPISRRFEWDGFLVQAFQKVVFQWRPDIRRVYFVNVFDRLSNAGMDIWLESVRSTPPSFDHAADQGLHWDAVVARHFALLDVNPAIKARYLADADPILHYGLPMSYKDYGSVFVVRAQRAVFQQWKVDVPWAKAGQVVIANGGDVAKEAGIYPPVATVPHTLEQIRRQDLIVGPGDPGRLYLLQSMSSPVSPTGSNPQETTQFVISDDAGRTWQAFSGSLPVEPECEGYLGNIDLDFASRDSLYNSTCRGLYHWSGKQWEKITSRWFSRVAVTYGRSESIWAIELGRVIYSTDGGRIWSDAGLLANAIALDPTNPRRVYALSAYKGWWYTMWRGTGESGQWTEVPLPSKSMAVRGMTVVGSTGEIYLITHDHLSGAKQLWRTANADALDVNAVRWDLVHDFGWSVDVVLLASGGGPTGLTLYARLGFLPGIGLSGSWFGAAGDDPVLVRSVDRGKTWEPIVVR